MTDYFNNLIISLKKGGKSQKKGSGIHINPKNEGKFTESARRAGMGVQEYAAHVLAHKENYDAITIRRANFARNASKWKHEDGGEILRFSGGGSQSDYHSDHIDSSPGFNSYFNSVLSDYRSPYVNDPGSFSRESVLNEYLQLYPDHDKRISRNFVLDNSNRIDFSKYTTPSGRYFIPENMNRIQDLLIKANIPSAQRAALLSTILQESGGDPSKTNENGKYVGLVQFSHGDSGRLDDSLIGDLEGQVNKIITEIRTNNPDAWLKGSSLDNKDISSAPKVRSGNEGRESFSSVTDPRLAAYYFNRCYVRPRETYSWKNRADESEFMYGLLNPDNMSEDPYAEHDQYSVRPIPSSYKRGGRFARFVRSADDGLDTTELDSSPVVVEYTDSPYASLSDDELDEYLYNDPSAISSYASVSADPDSPDYEAELYNMSRSDRKNLRKTGQFTFSNGLDLQTASRRGAKNLSRNIGRIQRREKRYINGFDPEGRNRFNTRNLSSVGSALHAQNKMNLYANAGIERLASDDDTSAYFQRIGKSDTAVSPYAVTDSFVSQPAPQIQTAPGSQMSQTQIQSAPYSADISSQPLKTRDDFSSDEEYASYIQNVCQNLIRLVQQFSQQAAQVQQSLSSSDNTSSQSSDTYSTTYKQ